MNLVKDCFDDPTVNLSVSPRELSLILTALNVFNDHLSDKDYQIADDNHERWCEVLDHIREQALTNSYRVPIQTN
jgi:hypothetical protein